MGTAGPVASADSVARRRTSGRATALVATALPCAFKLSFTPPDDGGSPILGYYAIDPKVPWVKSWAGSACVQKRSPILIQGGSGTHRFVVQAVNKNGVGPASVLSNSVTSPGTLPPATDPYWIYHAGSFNWEGDFSWPGGAAPPKVPGGHMVEVNWFDESVPALSGPGCVGVVLHGPGNFAPILGKTVNVVAPGYKYWTVAIRPGYDKPNFTIMFETVRDAVVTKSLPLNKYGTFTKDQWTTINIPIADFALRGRTIYKMLLETREPGSWHVDNLGFCKSPQPAARVPPPARGSSSPAAGAPLRIAFLGDSITDGYTYPQLVRDSLAKSRKIDVVAINAGIGGDTMHGMETRLERDVLDHHPDLVTISAGANDSGHGVTAEDYEVHWTGQDHFRPRKERYPPVRRRGVGGMAQRETGLQE